MFHLSHGTLVVIIPTQDGVVVCADKRIFNRPKGRYEDTTDKIQQLGDKGLLANTGFTYVSNDIPGGEQVIFDLERTLTNFFAGRDLSKFSAYKDELKHILSLEVVNVGRNLGPTVLRNSIPSRDNVGNHLLFATVLIYLDHENKPHITVIEAEFNLSAINYFQANVVILPQSNDFFNHGTATVMGETDLYGEVLRGTNSRFDDLRNNKDYRRFIFDNPPSRTVTVDQAVKFAVQIIKDSSERINLINPMARISPNTDCAILSYTDGFKWLHRNKP